MYSRECNWDGVKITCHDEDMTLRSGMGHNSRWHAIREGQYIIIVAWNTGLPTVSVEVFDIEDNNCESFDNMYHQESGVYESIPNFDTLAQENDETIGKAIWKVYQNYMIG